MTQSFSKMLEELNPFLSRTKITPTSTAQAIKMAYNDDDHVGGNELDIPDSLDDLGNFETPLAADAPITIDQIIAALIALKQTGTLATANGYEADQALPNEVDMPAEFQADIAEFEQTDDPQTTEENPFDDNPEDNNTDNPDNLGTNLDASAGLGQMDSEENDPDRMGEVRTVKGAHLVYKRQNADGTFSELWIYGTGEHIDDTIKIKKAILAGTDIPDEKMRSPDGNQSYELVTMGNAQMLHIVGLSN